MANLLNFISGDLSAGTNFNLQLFPLKTNVGSGTVDTLITLDAKVTCNTDDIFGHSFSGSVELSMPNTDNNGTCSLIVTKKNQTNSTTYACSYSINSSRLTIQCPESLENLKITIYFSGSITWIGAALPPLAPFWIAMVPANQSISDEDIKALESSLS